MALTEEAREEVRTEMWTAVAGGYDAPEQIIEFALESHEEWKRRASVHQ